MFILAAVVHIFTHSWSRGMELRPPIAHILERGVLAQLG
jgi:hypothetical protein